MYQLTYNQLLTDLHQAYYDARRHKGSKPYVKRFERRLEANLIALCDELYERRYEPLPSTCFVISDPKKREVFAANFRDRIVHHLYYNYTHEMYERTFIQDSYSCIRGRGTHYGVRRLERHIRQSSRNYSRPCYVLKLDVRGYFMHICRERLLELCLHTLHQMATHRILKRVPALWQDKIDISFVEYLTREIVLLNPAEGCRIAGCESDWDDLPHDKSLFHSPEGCGLPIGNLTSQLFSNVYLNALDQYMKRELGCRHYGRYVDDFYVVGCDRNWLLGLVPKINSWLSENMRLVLHDGKVTLTDIRQGVEFLGVNVLPYRSEVGAACKKRIKLKLHGLERWARQNRGVLSATRIAERLRASLDSFCGVLSHGRNYHNRVKLITGRAVFLQYGNFDREVRHFCCQTRYVQF